MDVERDFARVLHALFQQPGAYPYPFGSAGMGWLYAVSDATLGRLSIGRLRDQAVSVDQLFAEYKGAYLALYHVAKHQGLTPYLAEQLARTEQVLWRLHGQKQRLRARLDAVPQPRHAGRN